MVSGDQGGVGGEEPREATQDAGDVFMNVYVSLNSLTCIYQINTAFSMSTTTQYSG